MSKTKRKKAYYYLQNDMDKCKKTMKNRVCHEAVETSVTHKEFHKEKEELNGTPVKDKEYGFHVEKKPRKSAIIKSIYVRPNPYALKDSVKSKGWM
jgi:hypothetical protein